MILHRPDLLVLLAVSNLVSRALLLVHMVAQVPEHLGVVLIPALTSIMSVAEPPEASDLSLVAQLRLSRLLGSSPIPLVSPFVLVAQLVLEPRLELGLALPNSNLAEPVPDMLLTLDSPVMPVPTIPMLHSLDHRLPEVEEVLEEVEVPATAEVRRVLFLSFSSFDFALQQQ